MTPFQRLRTFRNRNAAPRSENRSKRRSRHREAAPPNESRPDEAFVPDRSRILIPPICRDGRGQFMVDIPKASATMPRCLPPRTHDIASGDNRTLMTNIRTPLIEPQIRKELFTGYNTNTNYYVDSRPTHVTYPIEPNNVTVDQYGNKSFKQVTIYNTIPSLPYPECHPPRIRQPRVIHDKQTQTTKFEERRSKTLLTKSAKTQTDPVHVTAIPTYKTEISFMAPPLDRIHAMSPPKFRTLTISPIAPPMAPPLPPPIPPPMCPTVCPKPPMSKPLYKISNTFTEPTNSTPASRSEIKKPLIKQKPQQQERKQPSPTFAPLVISPSMIKSVVLKKISR